MSDGQITNGQRAAHALDGINAHARSSAGLEHGMSEESSFSMRARGRAGRGPGPAS